jgi:hypothetical protein
MWASHHDRGREEQKGRKREEEDGLQQQKEKNI